MFKNRQFFTLFFVLLMTLNLTACSLKEISEQSEILNDLAQLTGKVSSVERTDANIMVAVLTKSDTRTEIISQIQADTDGNYKLNVLPGTYLIGAYIDKNNNKKREANESASMYSINAEKFTELTISKAETKIIPQIIIEKDQNIGTQTKVHYNANKIRNNAGQVVSLNNAMFAAENASIGLWRPIDFLQEVGGGLLFLQPFEANKIPVVFIHGISGNPIEFAKIINQLDRDRFQPWVLYYPSGVPLTLVSDYLFSSLNKLHHEYQFNDIQVISHSMGGLVARTYLQKHHQNNPQFDISLYVTINSPMLGMESAARGVESSPIVVASWRDLASGSDYIKAAHQWKIPESLPYHLFFSYLPNEDGDGVVPLNSQLSLSLQDEATRIYGSQAQHAAILNDAVFIKRLNNIMLKPSD
ncbi:alpha/beta hydrolase [Litorilituus lipolyticus]|uniref:Alpha/beta hydrolase n=1 Tax=Litorilituus lipolyticus TaxID=2491017 RepID=A0A502L5Z7_9GAMM|nr:alpha/beta hydrolase [Litorilituus lipolyticus]TPH18554.1 alpha/beta hydrolase [Litorilituus lipolyticus]